MGYSIEKNEPNWGRGSWGWYFSENPPGNFRFVTLPLEILEKTSFHPWKFTKIVWCSYPLGNSKVKNQGSQKFHMSFSLSTLGNSASFFVDPRNFHFFFLQYPSWKFCVFINPPPPSPPALLPCSVWFFSVARYFFPVTSIILHTSVVIHMK